MRLLTTLLLPASLLGALGAVMITAHAAGPAPEFRTSHTCLACHNGLSTRSGEDVSIGAGWRGGMMANSARDPYWQAGVRREVIDHAGHAAAIEAECSICHMPMANLTERSTGVSPPVFAHVRDLPGVGELDRLAQDGASCTVCHQVTPERLGTRESFTGGFVVTTGGPVAFGQYDVAAGRAHVMRSATGYTPTRATHLRESEVCATCHTLITHALGADAAGLELPEQVPYLEWQHSSYRATRSCQSCHMPVTDTPAPIASVLGEPREQFSEHSVRGGNFIVPRLLNLHRAELGTEAQPQEIEAALAQTLEHLKAHAARLTVDRLAREGDTLVAEVRVVNLAGHKLPTAYPSRRAWLHVTVRDETGAVTFESGRLDPSGRIEGNDNDEDGERFEPHYREIRTPGEVQIYESVMGDPGGRVTTGLLTAVRFLKDNRVLPDGFDKPSAPADVAVRGAAVDDADFAAGSDVVRYAIPFGAAHGSLTITAELLYQPIGWRWAQNLKGYDAPEPRRFVRYFDGLHGATATVLASTTAKF